MEDFLKHLIGYEIQTSTFCPYRYVFDDLFLEDFTKKPAFQFANIYFFCRVKKVRFDISKTKLLDKRTVETELVIEGSRRKKVTANFYDLSQMFKSIYKSRDEFNDLLSDDDPLWDCKFMQHESDGATLVFNQIAIQKNQKFEFIITPENFEFDLNLDLENPPEVVYVGQSFRLLDRVQSHKTLNKVVSRLNDYQDLRLYFLTFKFHYGGHADFADLQGDTSKLWMSKYGKTKEYKSKIDLVERCLIHFLKPEYNKQHVNSDITKDKAIKELLIDNGVLSVWINFGMYGNGFQFWSSNQALDSDFVGIDFGQTDPHFYSVRKR